VAAFVLGNKMNLLPTNNQIEDWLLVANDRISTLDRRWWYVLIVAILVSVPIYFLLRFTLFYVIYEEGPSLIIYQPAILEPLSQIDRQIFDLGDGNYSGYVKIKNINFNHGVPEQGFTAEFKTTGGSLVTKVSGRTFILPASEKLLVFSRFSSDAKPELLDFSLAESEFRYAPDLPPLPLEVERVQVVDRGSEFMVSAAIHNLSAFTIKQIHLPLTLYDASNRIIGVNLTNINEVKSGETRTVDFVWPSKVSGAARAEITPEINAYEPSIIKAEVGRDVEPFDAGEASPQDSF
jgi:hypothetical protein